MAYSDRRSAVISARILALLGIYSTQRDLGYAVGSDSNFDLGSGTLLQPHVAYIVKDRVGTLEGETFEGAPDLAVEVLREGASHRDVLEKARQYLRCGARMLWIVFPADQMIEVYKLNGGKGMSVDTVDAEGTLDGGELLPGFTLPVKMIFPN
ncbi:MAG: Uma2 family endonuclease [Anaerolineae bacterium]|nr:Uma2 family endonuclease [Anaerolineae bacterium]